jgi:polyhydroxyalkanoate synthesis regulator phasin
MSQDNKFFEDLLKLAGSAANVVLHSASDAKKQWDALVDRLLEDLLAKKSLVTQAEFEQLQERLAELEKKNQELEKKLQ